MAVVVSIVDFSWRCGGLAVLKRPQRVYFYFLYIDHSRGRLGLVIL